MHDQPKSEYSPHLNEIGNSFWVRFVFLPFFILCFLSKLCRYRNGGHAPYFVRVDWKMGNKTKAKQRERERERTYINIIHWLDFSIKRLHKEKFKRPQKKLFSHTDSEITEKKKGEKSNKRDNQPKELH